MPENSGVENLLNNVLETVGESIAKKKTVPFAEEESSISSQFNRLFGREKPVHKVLGGGKSADVLLWRNKKISSSVLTGATLVWVLFEWLNYHFLSLVCFGLVLGMLILFLWSNASGMISRSPPEVPRITLPEELFVNVAVSAGAQVNLVLGFLQDVACGRNLKQFLIVAASLLALSVIGSWCNFITVLYLGFVAAHTLPVLYEKYDDQVDGFVYKVLNQLQHGYKKFDSRVLTKIPTRPKKSD
ncbi:hypothetical protein AMTRI_Chr02g254110 [Amborella trichopoda]|uniref:Reticulon-like protein n=1 Tax=Amborella trichopoda TaxID=13333 RepID=W1NQQ5_AMBTC|nr:reticulon-like protein B8 [Amborella trichopoda]XP_020518683.1 reticulon-like protein B8 [Amborella trichopoda]ERM99266.1 hypothetical protein AMTR_s00092p00151450 [Amborella trichopoda]|eukprot:XP_006836413.1 reticulon-like protein B8 [Amborella trichopoda]